MRPAVALLHGLGRTARSMAPLARRLEAEGFAPRNIGYPSTRHRIEELARIVDGDLRPLAEAGPLHFVTHSLGGIVLRYWVKELWKRPIGRVVMLAPPNQGSEVIDVFGRTPWFKWALGPAGQQLGTGASSLPSALGPVPFECGVIVGRTSINPINWLVLPKPNDGKVSLESAKVEGMSDYLVVKTPHPLIMRSRNITNATVRFLREGRFA